MNGSLSDAAFVSALAAELAAGRPVALASLLATRGSMPRHEGARLALLADGRQLGTVGGGSLELIALDRARAALAGAAPSLAWFSSGASDMACGGDALLAVRALGPADAPAFSELADLLASDGAAAVEERWADPAAPTLALTAPGRLGHPAWDEAAATYREPVAAPSRLHVFGAGHVGAALVPLAARVGFEVRVYDDRPELARAELLPAAASVTCGAFEETAAAAAIGARDSVVVLTHGHAADETVLLAVLSRPETPAYVGCIGSRRKAALTREHLLAAEIDPARVAAVRLPIGEDILAVTPPEIAVSIAAQLIRCRAERRNA